MSFIKLSVCHPGGCSRPYSQVAKTKENQEYCPICNRMVSLADEDRVKINGYSLHISELLSLNKRKNRDLVSHLKNEMNAITAIDNRSPDQNFAKHILELFFKGKKSL